MTSTVVQTVPLGLFTDNNVGEETTTFDPLAVPNLTVGVP